MAFLQEDSSFTHIIAIDFGTGASGFGIAPKPMDFSVKPRIEVFNPTDDSDDQKTATVILFNNDGKFLSFGLPALTEYAEILDDDDTAMLFQSYKMHLLHLHENARAIDGREMSLMKVISETLRQISERAMAKLKEQVGSVVRINVRWVLTVPALWSEEHKDFMRRAAVEAEMMDNVNSTNLLLCLEPEGASIQCREDSDATLRQQMLHSDIVMVLDCGGGTVDITVHKLKCNPDEPFLCDELLPSSGGSEWGSKYVDIHFEQFLKEFFGDELFEIYLKQAVSRLDLIKHFEMLKRKFNPGKDERSRLQLSQLGEDLGASKLQEIVKSWNNKSSPDMQLKQRGTSSVDIPPALMSSFFTPLFDKICDKVDDLVLQIKERNENLKFVFMVGGFSESPFLKNIVKQKYNKELVQVLVPHRPQVSVVRGACLFGLRPRSIATRIAKKTYGINTLTTFDPSRHPESKKVIIEGEDFCEDVFDAFVRSGEPIASDEIHCKTYCPVRARQTVMRIIFYESDEYDPEFIDQEGVRQLGELSIDIGRPFQNVEDKTVKVTLLFGATNIYASATNKDGNEIKKSEFKFETSG